MIEHAILLCNFLSYKEHDAYVVLGRGIPDGLVAYVLLRDNSAASSTSLTNIKMEPEGIAKDKSLPQKYLLFNPSTGETYRIQDTHIPLKEIGCVFNSENVNTYTLL